MPWRDPTSSVPHSIHTDLGSGCGYPRNWGVSHVDENNEDLLGSRPIDYGHSTGIAQPLRKCPRDVWPSPQIVERNGPHRVCYASSFVMPDKELDTFESVVAARRERIEEHERLRASADYQAELKFSRRLSLDFARSLSLVGMYSTRARHVYDNMIVIRSCDDLIQSSLAIVSLVQEGFINPIHRELRYMIERVVKALYVDQMHSAKPLKERIPELASVPASLDVAKNLKLSMLDPTNAKLFVDELLDVYSKACGYVHPSRSQVEEQVRRVEAGAPLGFETVDHLRTINRVTRRAYDLLLVLFFHALGPSMSGDLFTMILDDKPDWTFHRGAKYIKQVAAYFDYKLERQ